MKENVLGRLTAEIGLFRIDGPLAMKTGGGEEGGGGGGGGAYHMLARAEASKILHKERGGQNEKRTDS
jgi:hypothetical protein